MVSSIFRFMYSSGAMKYIGAFLWGAASVILSLCGVSAVPLAVCYDDNTYNPSHLNVYECYIMRNFQRSEYFGKQYI